MKKLTYFTLANSIFHLIFNLINTFGVAFLFAKFNYSYTYSVGCIILIRLVYILLLPFIANVIGLIGTKISFIVSMLFLLAASIPLYYLEYSNYFVILWILFNSLSLTFYFLPAALYTSKYTDSTTRGLQISKINSGIIFAAALTPYVSGLIISSYSISGFAMLLAFFVLVGSLPLLMLKDLNFQYNGALSDIFRFNKSLLKASWIEMCHFSTRMLGIFWSLYIFIFFNHSYLKFGLILTAITLFSGLLNLLVGKLLNQHNRKDILKLQSVLSPFSWIFRLMANNPAGIFFADAFHSFNGYIRESAVETTAFDLINRDEHSEILDEKIVLREILINLGIIITLISGILLAITIGIKASFIPGILISLGYLLV